MRQLVALLVRASRGSRGSRARACTVAWTWFWRVPDLALDKSSEQGFCRFFSTLEQKRSNGDYYSVHGPDAKYVATVVYKTPSVLKMLGSNLPSCTMSRVVAESFMRDALLNYQLRVEIYASDSRQGSWNVSKTASPGNLQEVEEMLFRNSEVVTVPLVMAVSVRGEQVGVAFVDPAQRSIGVCEFVDNDLNVKECLIEQLGAAQSLESRKLVSVLDRCGVVITSMQKSKFTVSNIEQDLGRLVNSQAPVVSLPEYDLKRSMGALAAIIGYLNLLVDESNYANFTISTHNLSQYMKLDASAVQALNLMPSPQDGASKTMSLYGLLDRCKTSQGKRLLKQWLKQPLLSITDIEDRLGLVEQFFMNIDLPDFKRLSNRFQRGYATLQDIVRVYQVVVSLPALCDLVDQYYLNDLVSIANDLESFQGMVETAVDLEMADQHEFMLKADFDEGLQETKAQMAKEMHTIVAEQSRVASALGLDMNKKLKLEKHSTFGHCLKLSTLKTGVYFTTPTLRDASRMYRDLSSDYDKAQSALVREVIKVAASYCPVLERLNTTVAHLDVIASFAEASATAPIPYTRPVLTESGNVELAAARHPCLEVQEGISFIANDVSMTKGESEFVIITGPNMGGKSTYIRQIGVIALMAQVGCFVPCDSAQLCIFDCILARVGAGRCTAQGRMLETASILKTATENSLVIIDELGRGTSTYDGFGLAWAISEHIVKEIRSKCLFATHFHELTELEKLYPAVNNRHRASAKLTLLYKIGKGVCDQSFGIHVAELAQFPESVIKLAKRKVTELEDFSSVNSEPKKQGDRIHQGPDGERIQADRGIPGRAGGHAWIQRHGWQGCCAARR
ncbi:DNA mismatch repair protein [Linderina pennispora]|uniref:DNA mismatch repair protein n=1 Tax=Linderina pennispora TaxID=61395 RepID=A0A1Y1W3E2_9FUNG|nr:DNA mismatch repair protein [Linderina pennispora]ORX68041.1 DNA mismatch repair protein [Linderina pennispora]